MWFKLSPSIFNKSNSQQGRKLFSHPINNHYLNTFFIVMKFGQLKILMNLHYGKNAARKIETFN